MKKSNLLIIAAFAVAFCGLLVHDYQLLGMYKSGKYKDPFIGFTSLNLKDFDVIDVNSSSLANVKIEQGPFKVMAINTKANFIHISLVGRHLKIDATDAASTSQNYQYEHPYRVYISCPTLSVLNFNNKHVENNKTVTENIAYSTWGTKNVLKGFKLDSLEINEDNGSYVALDSNSIGSLTAKIGNSEGSAPVLEIKKGNNIKAAQMTINQKAELDLESPIPNLEYHISDSAFITLTGNVYNSIKK